MKSVVRIGANRKGKGKGKDLDEAVSGDQPQIDARAELIQALIPIGLEAVNDLLQQEVVSLVGALYSRVEGDYARWGRQPGSVYLGDHKVAVTVPRVRNLRRRQEVPLASYQALGRPRHGPAVRYGPAAGPQPSIRQLAQVGHEAPLGAGAELRLKGVGSSGTPASIFRETGGGL